MTVRACAACGTANEADARFCEGCGTALERSCGACGVAVSATARFCKGCGAPLGAGLPSAAEGPTRKTVTVLFADLAGSTAFEEIVDAETAREVIGRYHDLLRTTVERHHVGVTKYIGDGFMAVWGVPEIGADDARHAVEAAVELQERFVGLARLVAEAHGVQLALRVAVNTGEVVVGADDADLVGDALNVGARLESECPHGHVVVGEETWRSTRGRHRYEPLGAVSVKGRQAPVAVYQWLGHHSEPTDAITFVGRGDELIRLRMVFDNAVAARTVRLVTVTGDPGVGKTRLAAEFAGSLPGARVIEVRCAVEGSPALAPVVEVLRPRDLEAEIPADIAERDRLLRDLTGMTAGVPGSVEETFWALRRFFEVLAAGNPLVLVFDDIQWADSLLLDFIEHLAEWVRGAPVLMIALARPELRETRPDLVTVGGWVTEAVRLRGLEAGATAELAGRVLGSDRLPEELLRRLPTSTGGNPLFVRELVGMLVHDGVLAPRPEGWRLTVDADEIAVPPTIQALLASRLERLKSADRRVLEVASVIGTDFATSAVSELAGLREAEVTSALNRLRRLDLAQPSGTYAGDEAVWRFHHILIRDVAYRRLLKSERADLHERLADWVEAGGTNLALESDEVVARNLEAAQSYRLDLGLRDAHSAELALRSARSYLSSARRALDRDELVSAGTQAARGAALAAADTAMHAELLLVGCEAFLSAGDVAAGSPLVDELQRIAGEPLAPWAICYRCQLVVYTDPSRLLEVDERLQGAIDEFAQRADAAGLAKAHRVRANARARLGRVGDCEIDLFEALIAARRGGDHRQITAALGAAPNAALWGPSPAPKAGGRCLDVVRMQRMTTAAPSLEATSLRCLAVLELLRGRPDKARTMLADARQVVAELGLRHGLMETELFAGIIELMVGDAVAAEPHFRTALEGLDALGVGADAGQAAALLARSVLAQGRIDEADRYAAESERIAGHNLKTAIAWRAVRAEILSAQGQHAAAVALGREAVAVAADTDLVLDHADACLALSRVLAAAGDAAAAVRAHDDAESLYAAKDAVFMIGRTGEVVPAPSAQRPVEPRTSRLTVRNRATATADAAGRAMQAHDAAAAVALFSGGVVHDDHRRMRGNPIVGIDGLSVAVHQRIAQYPYVEWRHLAVRGETLELARFQWSDDAGNTSTSLDLFEIGDDDLITCHARFDEDDFESAYLEMEKRYYGGEGAPFAENGRATCAWTEAMWRRDAEAAGRVSWPHFRWLASPSALTPVERSVDEFFDWLGERAQQVSAMRLWAPTMHWMSPNCFITLTEIRGAGADGENYLWTQIYVGECRDGRALSMREFSVEDEDAAFAYAESLVTPKSRRLVVSNAASRVVDQIVAAMRANDNSAVTVHFSADMITDDRRRLAGVLITGIDYLSESVAILMAQYGHFQKHTLAVRGERLCLTRSRWSDDTGNQAAQLHVVELGDDGLIASLLYFDEGDFRTAYRELDARYYAGEGAAYANHGHTQSAFVEAINQLDAATARQLCRPEFRWLSPPTTLVAPVRTVDDLVAWWRERAEQVESLQNWNPALTWLSPEVLLLTGEARGVASDGAEYSWSGIYASTFRDGLIESVCAFEPEDEEAAFAYAESLVAQRSSRLNAANRATAAVEGVFAALRARDGNATAEFYAERMTYDDRRSLPGVPMASRTELREAAARAVTQYCNFESHTVAVRGERLNLTWSRWSDETGNESTHLHLVEIGEDGLIAYEGRFDEDDFCSAYRELENRYYAGEGAAYAENGLASAEWVIAINNADIERVRRISYPDFRWIATPSALKDAERTVDDMFRWMQERGRQVSSQRHWVRILHWLSPNCAVGLAEMTAIGDDGEKYDWDSIYVAECRDGLLATVREFDDESSAFAYAEGLVSQQPGRLALSNSASEVADAIFDAMRANDADKATQFRSRDLVYDDRRRIAGALIGDIEHLSAGLAMVLAQYKHFENRTLAVRGERLWLGWSRWSDGAGNEAVHLHVLELGADGLIAYECRFDEEDFESAYAELERRYYAGEGKPYAEEGMTLTEMYLAENRGDLDGTFDFFLRPGLQIASRSQSIFPTRTAAELRRSVEELGAMVTSYRVWSPAYCWLSPSWVVARHEREAVGHDGETYKWSRLYVGEVRDGQYASLCEFDVDDEDAAFAYAEERMRAATSRLAVTNRANEVGDRFVAALQAGDIDTAAAFYSDQVVYDDRRRFSGDPIDGAFAVRAAIERFNRHYNRFELKTLAVRGDRLRLAHHRWSDDAGNQSTGFILSEIDDHGRAIYDGRFDEDDFDSAYRELERRYYAGEGRPFRAAGATLTNFVTHLNRGDLDLAFGVFGGSDRPLESRSRSLFPDRTANELHESLDQLRSMVSTVRWWYSALCWLSPQWVIGRQEREATGPDDETYAWSRIYVGEFHAGVVTSVCEFDVDDEDAAFAYAEERMRATPSRLRLSNRASEAGLRVPCALFDRQDLDTAVAQFSERFVYEDRRGLTGDPIAGSEALRAALDHISRQYSRYDVRLLAVRGERLILARGIWSDDAGNQSSVLLVLEIDEDDRIIRHVAFDEDDFGSAYRELENRYYSNEGAEFAEQGRLSVRFLAAMDALDLEAARIVCAPTFRWFTPPSTLVAQERSLDEFFGWLRERADQVSSVRNFSSVIRWLSPTCFVALGDVQAQGTDGDEYAWARIYVGELRDGLLTSMRQFEDEEDAFAYAEERIRVTSTRLAVTNRATEAFTILQYAMDADDLTAATAQVAEDYYGADRRRLSRNPIQGIASARSALERILQQFNHFEHQHLAVRGGQLALSASRWSDDAGNVSAYLHVLEVDDDGRIVYESRYDEDDFESAYRELEERYYSGEGAAFAESGNTATEVGLAGNAGDLDRVFGELTAPGLRVDSRSGTIFPDRTVEEFRDSVEQFGAMVASARVWYSAVQWLSPNWAVARQEREAVGKDGERYTWTRIYVGEIRDGLVTAICDFDVEFEEQAFAYAEERMGATQSRLTVSNRANDAAQRLISALGAGDVEWGLSLTSEECAIDDRRRLAATSTNHASDPNLLRGQELLRAAAEGLLTQFNTLEMTALAVRGERLALCATRWSDDSGNESAHHLVFEVGDDDRLSCLVYFDEDNFEGAYQELERRYYAGEGAAFAEPGMAVAEYSRVRSRGDIDTLVKDLTAPDLNIESRSHSVFLDRSAAEYRASIEELARLVTSVREWLATIRWMSPRWCVALLQREAVGHEGEQYEWTRIVVGEIRNGRLASVCDFDLEDEDTAFAYAEEQVRATASPLGVTNTASKLSGSLMRAMQAGEIDIVLDHFSNDYVFEDHRRLGGDPIPGKVELRAAAERILQQFSRFERRVLAVRGERLSLAWSRWSDTAGNETSYLHVYELGDDDLIARDIRFDEDDFDGAYRELESRYYAGEGAAFAEYGEFNTDYIMTMNRGDFDTMFGKWTSPDFRLENRSRSAFPDRSAADLRLTLEGLYEMVASVRGWFSSISWLSPTVFVGRFERDGTGPDGEEYAWTRILVTQYRDGRVAALWDFDADDVEAAVTYAEELVRQT